jgi:glyoxylase-like metal-dependent hydrolase (beta-lactamase superfamily II)
MDTNRRLFLRSAGRLAAASVVGAGSASLIRPATAQTSAPGISIQRDNIVQISGGGGNVVAVPGRESAVVIDSGAADFSGELLNILQDGVGIDPVDILINTHWHYSHTGGNERLRTAATRIVAHENTRLWMSTEFYVRWEDRSYMPRAEAALPTDTFFSTDPQPIRLDTGDQALEYAHLENAHTDGDLYVFFPEQNVLVAGGAVAVGEYPVIDFSTGGWIDGLIDSTATLMTLADSETWVVPGSGPAQRRPHLVAQHEMVSTLRESVAEQMRLGRGVEEILALGISKDFDAQWGPDSATFIANIYADLAWRGPGGSL